MEAARQTFKRWRRRSLFVRLGSESQGRDQPSASLGAADLARKAGARETSRRTGVWLDADSICTDGTGKSGPFLYLLYRGYSSPPRSLRYRKGSLLRKTPTPSLAGAFWRDYHFAELRHTRFRTTCSDADVDVLRV